MNTLLLNKSQVESLLDLDLIQQCVEEGYCSFNKGLVIQPDFLHIVKPGTHLGFDFKGGLDMNSRFTSLKSSSGGFTENPALGLPTGLNMVYLYDADTSALKCIMDGTWITGCRTAAAGAISVKYLAKKASSKLAILGTGNQARRQLNAILRVRKIEKVYVFGYTKANVDLFVQEMQAVTGLEMIACETPEIAVKDADIVVTTTRARRGPVVQYKWLKPGTHIVAIGSDMPDKQEVEASLLQKAKVVADSISYCKENGEIHHGIEQGFIKEKDIYGEIGEIILGNKEGRINEEEITVFDSVGMAIQDNVMAAYLYQEAMKRGIGSYFDFLN